MHMLIQHDSYAYISWEYAMFVVRERERERGTSILMRSIDFIVTANSQECITLYVSSTLYHKVDILQKDHRNVICINNRVISTLMHLLTIY